MVSSLAGSLALVTCKEPLRVSLSNQLRVLLQQVPQNGLDQAALEQTVQTIVNDNLEVLAAPERSFSGDDPSVGIALAAPDSDRRNVANLEAAVG